ncbi:type IV secretory system conjugative DNA transfer family protein [Parvularcula flava]|uniref:Conjugal transfer protein TraG n=1 Tax=Aquisalinus luteolus TaxID=1566827 RepID=A0A8J3EW04_9PROT|nr:type IV secretory system conjugative DNA transfer family protein [Aquisalinus luteolus]NHK29632.1 type IV secretory system conjugative DNA transfer family protein [Aquisalinus luteolus]GGI02273.1 conjugal transfer protein TraG [Aquisalinus luteolus]
MTHGLFDPEDQRFGSARFAGHDEIARAGLIRNDGIPIGFHENRALKLSGDAPLLTVAGSGSGKLRDNLAYVVCSGSNTPMMWLDPRGELAAISLWMLSAHGIYGFTWNPTAMAGLPQHSCNPLDILRLNSPTFEANCKFIAEGLIPLSGSGNGKYFELRARDWAENITKARVEQNGSTSLPDLYRTINIIESDPEAWAAQLEFMLSSRFESVARCAAEMLTKQQEAPKEFGSILGEIYAYTSFLNDAALRESLEGGDFSLADLVDNPRTVRIYLNVPADYLSMWSPVLRIFFTVAMLYKTRSPQAPRILLGVDEAGQLGRFEALKRAFTFGRGAGIRTIALFQDIGQIKDNFGAAGVQGFIGSSQCRQFFGVRDYETAQLISNMLGNQTLTYDDRLRQEQAERQRWAAAQHIISGGDPLTAAYDLHHFEQESQHRTKQQRPLLSPDEILSLPEDRQLLFVSGKNLKPILAEKYPYFYRREMAGKYFPNPNHPPIDSILIQGRFRRHRIPVHKGPVPENYRHFPQYKDGYGLWLEGYPL